MPCFDRFSERLLHAGIAPRHVRRTVRELSDHFDDLVHEEREGGAARELAETRALSRLGNEDELASAMLARPELRSFMARFPWAVFGIGPLVLLAASVIGAIYLEIWLLNHSGWLFHGLLGMTPGPVSARLATQIYTGYNTLAVYALPLLFAWEFAWLGLRQRMRPAWIVTGVALVCILGGCQELVFYDKGYVGGGVLSFQSGLLYFLPLPQGSWFYSPHPHFVAEIAHAAMNLAIAGGLWWFAIRGKTLPAIAFSRTAT